MEYPNPPDHYRLFTTANALTPPSPDLLSGSEFYPMFGRPVPNIKHRNNLRIQYPAIDRDILLYDTSSNDFPAEARKLAQMLPNVVDDLLHALQTNPETGNEMLRKFDNVVKNMYHLIEVAREQEALDVIEGLAKQRVEEKRRKLAQLITAIENAERVADKMDET